MTRLFITLLSSVMLLALSGCAGGNEGGKLGNQLTGPLSHAYGPVDSISCEKSDGVKVPGGNAAYDCTAKLANGSTQPLCAGFANGVPVFDHVRCTRARSREARFRFLRQRWGPRDTRG